MATNVTGEASSPGGRMPVHPRRRQARGYSVAGLGVAAEATRMT